VVGRGKSTEEGFALDYPPERLRLMTKQEKKRLSSLLRATEYLFLENIALKLVLEHRQVGNWQKLLDRLLADKEMLAGVRLKFKDVYAEIEGSVDPSLALETLVGELTASKKTTLMKSRQFCCVRRRLCRLDSRRALLGWTAEGSRPYVIRKGPQVSVQSADANLGHRQGIDTSGVQKSGSLTRSRHRLPISWVAFFGYRFSGGFPDRRLRSGRRPLRR
jgi:hypothetical protein